MTDECLPQHLIGNFRAAARSAGPYVCAAEKEVRQITSRLSDLTDLHMVEDGA
jgi:hypothetical protein